MVGRLERNKGGKLHLSELEALINAGEASQEEVREFLIRRDLEDETGGHGSSVPGFSDYLGESRFTPTWDATDPITGEVHRHPCTLSYCSQCGVARPEDIQDDLYEGSLGRFRAYAGRRKRKERVVSIEEAEEMDWLIDDEADPGRSLYG